VPQPVAHRFLHYSSQIRSTSDPRTNGKTSHSRNIRSAPTQLSAQNLTNTADAPSFLGPARALPWRDYLQRPTTRAHLHQKQNPRLLQSSPDSVDVASPASMVSGSLSTAEYRLSRSIANHHRRGTVGIDLGGMHIMPLLNAAEVNIIC
jgi:hypothetical protein